MLNVPYNAQWMLRGTADHFKDDIHRETIKKYEVEMNTITKMKNALDRINSCLHEKKDLSKPQYETFNIKKYGKFI